jgi:uncharacterized protein (DUF2267 family)
MAMTGIEAVDTSVQKTSIWLKDLMRELNWRSKEKAYSVLRAVLQTIRDRLTVEESADFSAQLPLVVRGIYYDGWRPSKVPQKFHTKDDFLEHVRMRLKFDPDIDIEQAVRAVTGVIKTHVSEGQVRKMKGMMPKALAPLWK